ncbi:unnamed protein product [Acanthoscelides obtectus]|uniref:Uncharacterized protein n=1 Tax=Acanthoscelides obtectus TaxID=200917 RepID=A0A9P0KRI9_ACAOB|nr:unnamed protein product [Acanthoscelides obtectus]CAK1661939.1 hypothetical protein AOBTE_LOCUS22886 [Acanthoscelides obtectus]
MIPCGKTQDEAFVRGSIKLHQGLHTGSSFMATLSSPAVEQSIGWVGEGDLLDEVEDAGVKGIV